MKSRRETPAETLRRFAMVATRLAGVCLALAEIFEAQQEPLPCECPTCRARRGASPEGKVS